VLSKVLTMRYTSNDCAKHYYIGHLPHQLLKVYQKHLSLPI